MCQTGRGFFFLFLVRLPVRRIASRDLFLVRLAVRRLIGRELAASLPFDASLAFHAAAPLLRAHVLLIQNAVRVWAVKAVPVAGRFIWRVHVGPPFGVVKLRQALSPFASVRPLACASR